MHQNASFQHQNPTNYSLLQNILWICLYSFICTKFSKLILRKFIKIVAKRRQILRPKCTKFDVGCGFDLQSADPAGGAYSAPLRKTWLRPDAAGHVSVCTRNLESGSAPKLLKTASQCPCSVIDDTNGGEQTRADAAERLNLVEQKGHQLAMDLIQRVTAVSVRSCCCLITVYNTIILSTTASSIVKLIDQFVSGKSADLDHLCTGDILTYTGCN